MAGSAFVEPVVGRPDGEIGVVDDEWHRRHAQVGGLIGQEESCVLCIGDGAHEEHECAEDEFLFHILYWLLVTGYLFYRAFVNASAKISKKTPTRNLFSAFFWGMG